MEPTIEDLTELYLKQCWGPTKIVRKFKVSSGHIGNLLTKYRIPRHTNSEAQIAYWEDKRQEAGKRDPNLEQLRELYLEQKLSAAKIAPVLGCTKDHVYYLLNKYNIPRRKPTDPELIQVAIANLPKDCKGDKNGNWKGDAIASICPYCGTQFRRPRQGKEARKFCNNSCRSSYYTEMGMTCCGKSGPDSLAWKGGISKEPYPFEFDKDLKQQIRRRDNFTCQLCGKSQDEHFEQYKERLSCHHINYLKDDLRPENLISLCRSCHSKTHYNRKYWQSLFETKITQIYSGIET